MPSKRADPRLGIGRKASAEGRSQRIAQNCAIQADSLDKGKFQHLLELKPKQVMRKRWTMGKQALFRFRRTKHMSVRTTPDSSAALPYPHYMIKVRTMSFLRRMRLSALMGLLLCLQSPLTQAQNISNRQTTKTMMQQGQSKALSQEQRSQAIYGAYILGPGDGLQIELFDLPELSGVFSVGPDGTIYLPRLRSVHVDGLTVEELREVLTQEFRTYVRDPQVYVRPVYYRPIRVYVGGEVKLPGYYTLTGGQSIIGNFTQTKGLKIEEEGDTNSKEGDTNSSLLRNIPTVFDAIRSAQGVTPYSDLSRVKVIRKRGEGLGGGRISTTLNFLTLITDGNESQNIRLFDGDVVRVSKSNEIMGKQLLKAVHSNINPRFINVFVSGRVANPSGITIPNGSSLNQAIATAGGADLIRGRVEFVRFAQDGETKRKLFSYNPRAAAGAEDNPILASGDLIRVRESILSATTTVLDEITAPALGIYTIFSLLEDF